MDGVYYNGVKQWGLEYDANGNVTSVTHTPTGKTTSYTYDKNNRVTKIQEGSSNSINYGYDNNDNLSSLTVIAGTTTVSTGYTYNPLQQVTALTRQGASQAKFVYDERGNVISITKGNNTYTAFEYDDANRLKSVKNYNANGALLDSYTYTYDANSNRTSVVTNAGTISYQYDVLNRLTLETLLDGTTISYEYDAVGNRTKKTVTQGSNSTTTTYTYDNANQLTAVNGQAYTYDANGNLTSNGAKTYIYDAENRLVEVKDSTGTSLATFTYDHEGKRSSMTTSSGTTYFHYNGDKVVYETDANNQIVAEYTWDAKGNLVSMTKNGATYFYHINGHGDVTKLTDANGNVVAEYEYDAWGNITSSTGTMKDVNPYRYAGYRYDGITGLYYLMARYYDPSVGRFITRDTFHGFEEEPSSLNQYVYTANNPVMRIDASGHMWTPWGDMGLDAQGNFWYVNDVGFGTKLAVRVGLYLGRIYWRITPGGLIKFVGQFYVGSLYKAFKRLIDTELAGLKRLQRVSRWATRLHEEVVNYLYGMIGDKNINIARTGLYYVLDEDVARFW
jgi:RHS repeat-associated protein